MLNENIFRNVGSTSSIAQFAKTVEETVKQQRLSQGLPEMLVTPTYDHKTVKKYFEESSVHLIWIKKLIVITFFKDMYIALDCIANGVITIHTKRVTRLLPFVDGLCLLCHQHYSRLSIGVTLTGIDHLG
jgi:hypothetical protein